MNKMDSVKLKLRHELKLFWIYTLFLSLLFFSFIFYQRVLLDEYSSRYIPFGYSIIEAMILAKIILIGESFGIGETNKQIPLIFIVLYKTILFCILVLIFNIVEHCVDALIHGRTIASTFTIKDINIKLARTFIMFFTFSFFFAFKELNAALGENKLFDIFFKKRSLEKN